MRSLITILWAVIFLLSACNGNEKKTASINEDASLPAAVKFNIVGLKLSASFIDKKSGSMSALYSGNETRTLVTWQQKSDENWYGANIPGKLLSIEIVKTPAHQTGQGDGYTKYNGKGLLIILDTVLVHKRVNYILSQQPSFMP